MSQKTTTIGRKNVDVIGRFQLRVNRDPKRFRITNINSFVPFGKTAEQRVKFMSKAGLVDALVIDKTIITFNPDKSDIDLHNVQSFINHPDVRLDGFSDLEHQELVRQNLKKSNPKFTLTNIDKVADEKHEEEVKLIQLRARLYDDKNPLSKETLVHLCSNFGIAYKNDITEPKRYVNFLLKKIDSFLQVNKDNREAFTKALDNLKLAETIYYINEFIEMGIVSDQSGIWKIKDRPVGASKSKVIEYFESNPTEFGMFKEEVIKYNSGKIHS